MAATAATAAMMATTKRTTIEAKEYPMRATDGAGAAAPRTTNLLAGIDGHPVLDEQERLPQIEDSDADGERRSVTVLVAAAAKDEALGAGQVAAAIADGILATLPSARVLQVPDAGTGHFFIEQMVKLSDGWVERISLLGPHGELTLGQIGFMGTGSEFAAVIAADEIARLDANASWPQDPTAASSRAIGQLIVAALDRGVRRIVIACGSRGACDGGIGMAGELGIRFVDAARAEIVEAGGLLRLAAIDMSHRDPRLAEVTIQAVVHPGHDLLGPHSVMHDTGICHGTSPAQALRLEQGLARFAHVVGDQLGIDLVALPGSGGGGGLAAGLVAFAGASLVSRFDFLEQSQAMQAGLACADVAVTAKGTANNPLEVLPAASPSSSAAEIGYACAWLERKAFAMGLPTIALSLEQLLDPALAGGVDDSGLASPSIPGDGTGQRKPARNRALLRAASAEALQRTLGSGWQHTVGST